MDFLDDLFGSDEETSHQNEQLKSLTSSSSSSSSSSSTSNFSPLAFYTSSSSYSPTSLVEIRENPKAGGARGVFARRRIEPGSLLVLEWPIIQWKNIDFSSREIIKEILLNILSNPKAHLFTQSLYPYTLEGIEELKEEINEAFEFLRGENDKENILKELRSLMTQKGNNISEEEIVRIFLTLRHNGFSSGLYLSLCMINHSCLPNAIKFEPRAGSRGASEVWSTQVIEEGEEILINYCSPLETLVEHTHRYLSEQHNFTCSCQRCTSFLTSLSTTQNSLSNLTSEWKLLSELEELIELNENIISNEELSSSKLNKLLNEFLEIKNKILLLNEKKNENIREYYNILLRINKNLSLIYSRIFNNIINKKELNHTEAYKILILWINNSISILNYYSLLLQVLHPDLLMIFTDISQALEFISRYLNKCLPVKNSYLNIIEREKSIENNIEEFILFEQENQEKESINWNLFLEVLKKLNNDINLDSLINNDFIISSNLMNVLKTEISRLKNLYFLPTRQPAALRLLKESGKTYWGEGN